MKNYKDGFNRTREAERLIATATGQVNLALESCNFLGTSHQYLKRYVLPGGRQVEEQLDGSPGFPCDGANVCLVDSETKIRIPGT